MGFSVADIKGFILRPFLISIVGWKGSTLCMMKTSSSNNKQSEADVESQLLDIGKLYGIQKKGIEYDHTVAQRAYNFTKQACLEFGLSLYFANDFKKAEKVNIFSDTF